jgi:hypothetical protein
MKITGIILATTLSAALALSSISCTPDATTTPTQTTPPITATPSISTEQEIAEKFVINSATFKFDGIEGSLKFVKAEQGPTSSFKSTVVTLTFQTQHPGHGDRTGEVLAQVITDHIAVILVNTENQTVASAVCDETWDMIDEQELPVTVTGTVISGGDTAQPNGPQDVPHQFVYTVQKADGTQVNVSYMAYPPSPVGDAYKAKITLDFYAGTINIGDKMEALGTLDKETNTVVMANQGDYIKTFPADK